MKTIRYSMMVVSILVSFIGVAQAGVFDLPGYVEAKNWSVGLEPEIAVSNGTGAAMNVKPRYGVNDILSWEGLIGTGSGARKFRMGILADFEWFPDYDKQPGIATPVFMEYYRIDEDGNLTFGAKPMVYKTFASDMADFTPFAAVPMGWNYRNSDALTFIQFALGTMIKLHSVEKWRFTAEAGFNVKDSYSYISGGATYYH